MSTQPTPLYFVRQFRLLIAGSRHASAKLIQKAFQAVERAKANGWSVLVGDAEGIDSAVIAACNKLLVNYVCCGIAPKPRSVNFISWQDGGLGRYIRVASSKPYDYAARDRYMADLADRGLFIWNGHSKGTRTVYEYMTTLGKPADLIPSGLTANADKPTPASTSVKTPAPKPTIVEVILDATSNDGAMSGTLGLRALDSTGAVLYQTRQAVAGVEASTADYAKLALLITALERLKQNIKGQVAAYSLRIVQSSQNVDGWLGHGWKRNAEQVQTLGRTADVLLKSFPSIEWAKMPRPQITSALSKIQ